MLILRRTGRGCSSTRARSRPSFRRFLGGGSREALDQMFDQARSNCMAAGNAVRPVVFEEMLMATAFSHGKRIDEITKGIEELKLEKNPESESE